MRRAAALLILLLLAACAGPRREAFTADDQAAAVVLDLPGARVWGDAGPAELASLGMRPEDLAARGPGPIDYLAISSGGPAGAFGAGVLVGWTEAGTRPDFDVVTGVSSGALLAPFAFVGSSGDPTLRALWAGGVAEGIGRNPNPIGLLTGRGLLDPGPLRALLDRYVTDDLLAAIAREHAKGRRLLVMTTNLDAQRPVIWNIGALAASGRPGAGDLIRDILVASASIPVAFPPALVDATAAGRPLREMHVDGGVSAQIFALPDAVLSGEEPFAIPPGREARLWLLVNYVTRPEFANTPGSSLGVGARAYGTLIKSDLRSELFALGAAARDIGLKTHLASVPTSVSFSLSNPFSGEVMAQLFELGRARARGDAAFAPPVGGRS